MSERDEREQAAREREGRIPAAIVGEAHRNVHLMAAARRYIRGDTGAWEECLAALRADCDRLAGEVERHGHGAVPRLAGEWPGGTPAPGEAMTGAQCVALLHATEAQRVLFGLVCRLALYDTSPMIVVQVAK
jgi:hypothetical protein